MRPASITFMLTVFATFTALVPPGMAVQDTIKASTPRSGGPNSPTTAYE